MPYLDQLRFQVVGIWMYDVHWQLGTAADGCLEGD